jgi:hypothetical protein
MIVMDVMYVCMYVCVCVRARARVCVGKWKLSTNDIQELTAPVQSLYQIFRFRYSQHSVFVTSEDFNFPDQ